MNILALDLAASTGWATSAHGRIESGVQRFDLKRGESPGMRFVHFNGWLSRWAPDGYRPDLIVYEQNFRRGGAATEIAAGFSTRVKEFCARNGVEHTTVNVTTLKKFATGKGNADKDAMAEAAHRRGWITLGQPKDDNEIDAIALLYYALTELVTVRAERET